MPPLPGTIGVTPTYGNKKYDRIIGDSIRWVTGTRDAYSHKWHDAPVNHAVVYVGDVFNTGSNLLMEARPADGVGYAKWDKYGSDMIWLENIGQKQLDGTLKPLTPDAIDRAIIVKRTQSLFGNRYGFLDILAVAYGQDRVRALYGDAKGSIEFVNNPPWWARQIQKENRDICSQVCDFAWNLPDLGLFKDRRLPGLVTPADLYALKMP